MSHCFIETGGFRFFHPDMMTEDPYSLRQDFFLLDLSMKDDEI